MRFARKLITIGTLAAVLTVIASPAMADRPVLAEEDFPWTYEIENPCSAGEFMAL